MTAIDITEPAGQVIKSAGIAYFRVTPEFRDFLKQCKKVHGVIGFEWYEDELNFGVILGNKQFKIDEGGEVKNDASK